MFLITGHVCVSQSLNHVHLFATLWTVAHQAPLSMGLFGQEYWSGLPFLYPGDMWTVQLSRVRLSVTPWTAARQSSLSITNSRSLLKLMSIESVMPSSHLILCRLLLLPPSIFPSIRVFSSESFASGGQSIGVSASASALPMNIQD